MFNEAAEAATAVRRQAACCGAIEAAKALAALNPPLIVTCARGSSDHAATYFQYLAPILLKLPCYSHPPSLAAILHATSPKLASAAMILISQSGRSPDLLRSAEAARRAGMRTFGLVNDTSSPLADLVDHVVPLHAGEERSVAATKSFVCALTALLRIAASAAADTVLLSALAGLPDALERAWAADWSEASDLLARSDQAFVLGRDLTLGIAGEAALKLKEVAGIHAEALSMAEVAHGPMALVGPDMPVIAFASDASTAHGGLDLLARFRDRGAPVILAGATLPGTIGLPLRSAPAELRAILAIQSFYRVAETVARARGRNPDHPPSLAKVTETL